MDAADEEEGVRIVGVMSWSWRGGRREVGSKRYDEAVLKAKILVPLYLLLGRTVNRRRILQVTFLV